jgi:hypothetical protein
MNPKDCRAMADQCLQWVHDARSVDERRAYLKLAHVWLEAALADEDAPPAIPAAPRLPRVTSAVQMSRLSAVGF